jgi:predicted ATPase
LEVVDGVIEALRTRQLLLVLDNCEHVVDIVRDVVDQLLGECPGVQVIVTSREALGVAGEQVWPLRELDLPPAGATAVAVVAGSSAARLFEERARAVQPGFEIEPDSAAVAEICRRLDGIPLALELRGRAYRSDARRHRAPRPALRPAFRPAHLGPALRL